MRDLSKRLRGGDFRHAVEAVAALRRLDPATGAGLVPSRTSSGHSSFWSRDWWSKGACTAWRRGGATYRRRNGEKCL